METIQWLEPWLPINDTERRVRFQMELFRECGPDHPLTDRNVVAIAMRQDQDEVLFQLASGEVAEVHLTFSSNRETDPYWPRTKLYESLGQWVEVRMKRIFDE